MLVETKDIIQRPCQEVYTLVRDHLPEIVPYLPNIRKIDVLQRQNEANGTLKVINHWYAQAEVPMVAKKFIKEELFSWKDTAFWDDKTQCVSYTLESFWANDLFDAKGKNYFTALSPQETELKVTCEVVIHPDKVPGVPKFLVGKVLPTIEEMIKNMIRPNLSSLGKGLNLYFQSKK